MEPSEIDKALREAEEKRQEQEYFDGLMSRLFRSN